MCAPMAMAAIGIAGQLVQFGAAQADYSNKAEAWKANYTQALDAASSEQKSLQLRATQEEDAASQKKFLSHVEEAQKVAEAQVVAADGGVSGVSVDNIVGELTRSASYNRGTIEANSKMTAAQLTEELKGTNFKAQQRINSMERPTSPSGLGLLVGIAGSGIKAFA